MEHQVSVTFKGQTPKEGRDGEFRIEVDWGQSGPEAYAGSPIGNLIEALVRTARSMAEERGGTLLQAGFYITDGSH